MSIKSIQDKEIHESLEQFGLALAEREVYLQLIQHGATTVTPLARSMEEPATTVQSILQRLAKLGVVHVMKQKSRSVYEARDPRILKTLLEQRLREVSDVIPLLQALRTDAASPARLRVYQRERVTDIFLQALQSHEKMVYEIVSAQEIQDVLGERFHFTRRRQAAGVHLKSLRVEAREIKKYSRQKHIRELREAKFLPRELTFRCSVMFWDDKIAFFTPASESLAWMVQSKETVLMFKQLFDLLWSVGHKMETATENLV